MSEANIERAVITGGPCSGKTTALLEIPDWVRAAGYSVAVVEEQATRAIEANLGPRRLWRDFCAFQTHLLRMQLATEQAYEQALAQIGSGERGRILLCDRGALDFKAYVDSSQLAEVLRRVGVPQLELMDRYSIVVHLVTAADGAEEFYTLENNDARTESPEEARVLDKRTQEAWLGSEHLRIIDNSTDFPKKLLRLRQALARGLGIPVPIEDERKFLIKPCDPKSFPVATRWVELAQRYLHSHLPGEERRIRCRTLDGSSTFFQTTKRKLSGTSARGERTRRLDIGGYNLLLEEIDATTKQVRKLRYTFLWKGQYFELDIFCDQLSGLYVLEIELTEEQQVIEVPPFIKVVKEVTGDPEWSNASLARREKFRKYY